MERYSKITREEKRRRGAGGVAGSGEGEPPAPERAPRRGKEEAPAASGRGRKTSEGVSHLPPGIPRIHALQDLAEEERVCPVCGAPLAPAPIGDYVTEQLRVTPTEAAIVRRRHPQYECGNCQKKGAPVRYTRAPNVPPAIRGSFITPETLAWALIEHFVEGTAYYRMEEEWAARGVPISRQTMSNWAIRGACRLTPLYARMREDLKAEASREGAVRYRAFAIPGRKSQGQKRVFMFCAVVGIGYRVRLYACDAARRKDFAEEFLSGSLGPHPGEGRDDPEHAARAGCWAHMRGCFYQAVLSLPKERRVASVALAGLRICNDLFRAEREYEEGALSSEERLERRTLQSRPLVERLFRWLEENRAELEAESVAMKRAVAYAMNQSSSLTRFLEDGSLELSDRASELMAKAWAALRRCRLFSSSEEGARTAAIVLSVVDTAKANGLDPYRYLAWLFETLPPAAVKRAGEEPPPELVESMESFLPGRAPEFVRTGD